MFPKISEHGIVLEPPLHDGYVDALKILNHETVCLCCRTSEGKTVRMYLTGIRALRGNDFREGNIIADLWVYQGAKIPQAEIESLLSGKHSKEEDIKRLVFCIHNSDEHFVHLCPSYGLEVKALCKKLTWE